MYCTHFLKATGMFQWLPIFDAMIVNMKEKN